MITPPFVLADLSLFWQLTLAAGIIVGVAIQVSFIVRVLLKRKLNPVSRLAWLVVLFASPGVGVIAYLLLGDINIGDRRLARIKKVVAALPTMEQQQLYTTVIEDGYQHLFQIGRAISEFSPVSGNAAQLLPDSTATIDAMVIDIDQAQDHVHVEFYIWLDDASGLRIAQALERAAKRGVACRAMADGLGSRLLIRSPIWQSMQDAGVQVGVSLPIGNPFLQVLFGRIDLRNHRKLVVIDGQISYCGSQNIADEAFRIKPKYAPWVDVMFRFTGPITQQHQNVFVRDWMCHIDEDICGYLNQQVKVQPDGMIAQVIATGPVGRYSAMPEVFESLLHTARHSLTITTPYYVPNESLQAALCATANRGVDTTLILPARNDSFFVAAASRSYYLELLEAGVNLFEYRPGLLHAKTLTMDGRVSLVGSSNLDRRSFDLNFENNVMLIDRQLTTAIEHRQQTYLNDSNRVTMEQVLKWPIRKRLINNVFAMMGPIL